MNTTESKENDDDAIESRAGVLSIRICAVMLVLYALYYARSLVIPVATAIVLYLTLRPIVRHAKRIGVPAPVGAIGIIAGILLTLGLGTYVVLEPAKETIAEAPKHLSVAKSKLAFITDRLKDVDEATEELAESEEVAAGEAASEKPVPVEIKQPTWTSGWSYLSGTGNVVSFLTICIALLYFLLATGDDLLRSVMRSLPDFSSRRKLVEVIENVQEGLGSYLAQVSAINAGLGVCVGIVMWILGMPSPIMWAVMAFAFNFIPIVGAIAGAIIIFFVALLNFEPTYYAFVVTLSFMTLTSLEGQFITPAILGRSMSMSPVLVFLSIVIWGWMWGIMGVFLSVPILIAARMACEGYDDLRPLAMILGAEMPEADAPKTNTENETSASTADSEKRHVPHENVPSTHSPIPQSISQ